MDGKLLAKMDELEQGKLEQLDDELRLARDLRRDALAALAAGNKDIAQACVELLGEHAECLAQRKFSDFKIARYVMTQGR